MSETFPPYLIGVGGGSASGKTTFARVLAGYLPLAAVLDLDSYYLDRSGLPPEDRVSINYDEPAAFDLALLLQHLHALREGHGIEKPRYSFSEHARVGRDAVPATPIVIVEGLFTLWWAEVRSLLSLRVFMDTAADLRLLRRVQRDVVERGRDVGSVLAQYVKTVRPSHERYLEETRSYADIILDGNAPADAGAREVMSALWRIGRPGP